MNMGESKGGAVPSIEDVIDASHKLDPNAPELLRAYVTAGGSPDDTDPNPKYSKWSLLRYAVEHWHTDMIDALVELGADVNLRSGSDGFAPIHHAVDSDIDGVVQASVSQAKPVIPFTILSQLVDHGASLTLETPEGETAHDLVSGYGGGFALPDFEKLFGAKP